MSEQPAGQPPAEVIIGLDVGTTATKVVAFGLGSPWRHTAVREYPLLQPEPGWQVQDPSAIAAAVRTGLTDCVTAVGGSRVVGIAVSSAMHGLVGLDSASRPLTPLVTWADARAADQARGLRTSGQGAELHLASGTPVHSMSPLTKLMWFARHEPELCSRVRWWLGLKDYVLGTLTGTLATELSSASGTGLLDLGTRDWNPDALELAGVSADQLPPILPTTSALGLSRAMATRVGLPVNTPVIVGAGDGPLGNLGTGALDPGVVGLSLGTSGAVRMLVPEPAVDPGGRLFCYALTDDAWAIGGAISNGGAVIRWAGDVFGRDLIRSQGEHPDAALLELAATVPPGSDGLVMLPYLLAERAPLWNPDLRAAFLGLRHMHTRGHFIRAAVEGVALQLAVITEELHRIEPVTSVRATGGVFRSVVWRQVIAGALGVPLYLTGGAEGSARGAAALGLVALGRAPGLHQAVAALTRPQISEQPPLVPEQQEVAHYARIRASVGPLLRAYDEVSELFASQPPADPA